MSQLWSFCLKYHAMFCCVGITTSPCAHSTPLPNGLWARDYSAKSGHVVSFSAGSNSLVPRLLFAYWELEKCGLRTIWAQKWVGYGRGCTSVLGHVTKFEFKRRLTCIFELHTKLRSKSIICLAGQIHLWLARLVDDVIDC